PELTSEKFIAHPYSSKPGARLYKTGDLARYRPDGTIECLGRLDTQVKLRGFRIELGEVEAVLCRHASVGAAAVVVREDALGDPRLVAYFVPLAGRVVSPAELRDYVKEQLPSYMIPTAYVLMDALPLTPNGKIDRHALPVPDFAQVHARATFVAPTQPL